MYKIKKSVKPILLFALLWTLTIVLIKSINRSYKILSGYENEMNVKMNDGFSNDDVQARSTSLFRAWQYLPEGSSNLSLKERFSVIEGYDTQPGFEGRPVILKGKLKTHIQKRIDKGWENHAFNSFVSDLIPVNRTIPDFRFTWCKKRYFSNKSLPKATVVICFHNEALSTLLRTLHSVLYRSPEKYLDEIILVNDGSTMNNLELPLKEYLKHMSKIKLIHTRRRRGIVGARLFGMKLAQSPIVVFLDSHCECAKGWLEPLLERISENHTIVASPVIDNIHSASFEYIPQDVLHIGGFTWDLNFSWMPVPDDIYSKRKNELAPIQTPTISGGLFAINKNFFEKIGFYDENFYIWGAENLELSFKAWMCGGSVEIIPCSHVGHVFRNRIPYGGIEGSQRRNNVRLAEVWLDDYAKYFYERIGNSKGNFGDVSNRKKLRSELKCKSFEWYLKNVYPHMKIPDDYVARGQIMTLNYENLCLDSSTKLFALKDGIHLLPCHHLGGNQFWAYTKEGEIQRDNMCLDYMFHVVSLYICLGKDASQMWIYNEQTHTIKHMKTGKCLSVIKTETDYKIVLQSCITIYSQKWKMERFTPGRISPELQNAMKEDAFTINSMLK